MIRHGLDDIRNVTLVCLKETRKREYLLLAADNTSVLKVIYPHAFYIFLRKRCSKRGCTNFSKTGGCAPNLIRVGRLTSRTDCSAQDGKDSTISVRDYRDGEIKDT